MRTTLLITRDSVRALLHQRLLIGLMAVALAVTAIFSVIAISEQRMFTSSALAQSEAASDRKITPETKAPSAPRTRRDPLKTLSKEDRAKLAANFDQLSSVMQGAFYQVTSFGGSLVALFIFSMAVSSEIRRGTIKITLTKPVSRTQYILGKYLGGVMVMASYACLASLAIYLFARFGNMTLSPAMKYAPWLMFCRQLMLGSAAMLLSLFMHPFLGAVVAFFVGNGYYGGSNPLYYLLPSYDAFNLFGQMLKGTLVHGPDVAWLSVYALDFIVLMLVLTLWRFRTKELV